MTYKHMSDDSKYLGHPDTDNPEYDEWIKNVDDIVSGHIGFGLTDLPDLNYYDAFETGMLATDMADDIIRDQGLEV